MSDNEYLKNDENLEQLIKDAIDLNLFEINNVLSYLKTDQIKLLIQKILYSNNIFFVGVGRMLLSAQTICKRLNHLDINAFYVGQIDEPRFTSSDLLIVCSGSGETAFPVVIANKAKKLGGYIAYIGNNDRSTIGKNADLKVIIPEVYYSEEKVLRKSKLLMSTLNEQTLMILGDVISLVISNLKEFDQSDNWFRHANLE